MQYIRFCLFEAEFKNSLYFSQKIEVGCESSAEQSTTAVKCPSICVEQLNSPSCLSRPLRLCRTSDTAMGCVRSLKLLRSAVAALAACPPPFLYSVLSIIGVYRVKVVLSRWTLKSILKVDIKAHLCYDCVNCCGNNMTYIMLNNTNWVKRPICLLLPHS